MKSFYVFRNKDSADAYVNALLSAGYEPVKKMSQADFILYDTESVGRRRDMKSDFIAKRGPAFIYPHTPLTCYIWDGIYEPLPAAINFVAGDGTRKCMQAYGYPNRVEVCGFPRCEVLDFVPAKEKKLLFVPARPRRDHGKQARADLDAFMFIHYHRDLWDSVTICQIEGQYPDLKDGYLGWNIITTNPKASTSPAGDMIDRIDRADIVIAVTTPAALAVARGKPTIMYGHSDGLETLNGRPAKNYLKYKSIYDYPLDLINMDIEDVMGFAEHGDSQVERWKRAHIGGNFDAEKFVSLVREYV